MTDEWQTTGFLHIHSIRSSLSYLQTNLQTNQPPYICSLLSLTRLFHLSFPPCSLSCPGFQWTIIFCFDLSAMLIHTQNLTYNYVEFPTFPGQNSYTPLNGEGRRGDGRPGRGRKEEGREWQREKGRRGSGGGESEEDLG